jgi:hypothetical protein
MRGEEGLILCDRPFDPLSFHIGIAMIPDGKRGLLLSNGASIGGGCQQRHPAQKPYAAGRDRAEGKEVNRRLAPCARPSGDISRAQYCLLAGPRKASSGAEFGYPAFRRRVVMAESDDFKLVREIVAEGGRRYTNGNVDRSRYRRLVDPGWLNAFPTNMSDVMYQVTQRGKAAAKRF